MIKPEWVVSSTMSDFEDVSTMGSCSAQGKVVVGVVVKRSLHKSFVHRSHIYLKKYAPYCIPVGFSFNSHVTREMIATILLCAL